MPKETRGHIDKIFKCIAEPTTWLIIYVACIPFMKLWYNDLTQAKVEPTELAFIGLVIAILIKGDAFIILASSRYWILAFLLYLSANLLSSIYAGNISSIAESLGRGYLFLLFISMVYYIKQQGLGFAKKLVNVWMYSAVAMCAIALVGYVIALLGWNNTMVEPFANYPYLGNTIRLEGFTGGPGAMVLVITLPIFWSWYQYRSGKMPIWRFLLLQAALVLTFSKSILLIWVALFLIDPLLATSRVFKYIVSISASLLFLIGTHFIFIAPSSSSEYLENTEYSSQKLLANIGDWQVLESSYLSLKRAGLAVGIASPFLGVGTGNFNAQLPKLKEKGVYPTHLPDYDPHSTWIGAFAENGILGLAGLLVFVLAYCRKLQKASFGIPLSRIVFTFTVFLFIESLSMDIANFRCTWAALALLIGVLSYDNDTQA